MVYTVTLNPSLDYVVKTDSLSFDDINRASSSEFYYGGKGINVSAVLTRLGVETSALGFIGGFMGKKLLEMLKDDGIKSDFSQLEVGETRVNVKLKSDRELDINTSGPTVTEADTDRLLKKLDLLSDGDFLVLAGSVPKSVPCGIYARIAKRLCGKKVHLVVDTTGEELLSMLEYRPFLIKPNHKELGELFGVSVTDDGEVLKYARRLCEMGAENVLVSRAEQGALLLDGNGQCHKICNAEGKLINSTGCGDSMVAGFIAGFIRSRDFTEALTLGSACGNASAFCESLPTANEINAILSLGIRPELLKI